MLRILLIALAMCATAQANVGASMLVHASAHDGIEEGGAGVMLEASHRRGRLEVFGDLGLSVMSGKRDGMGLGSGEAASVLGGVRVIPRSFQADEVAFELAFDVFAGGQLLMWSDDDVTRPLLGAGAGWQVRFNSGTTVRVMMRLFTAPTFGDRDEPVCRGTCPDREIGGGFMGLAGASW